MTETSAGPRGEHSATSPSLVRPASTVILIRRAATEFEVLLVRRLASAASFADVFVFPGGAVRVDDEATASTTGGLTPSEAMSRLSERGGHPPENERAALAYYRAAIRELFEETGVILARDRTGRPARLGEEPEQWAGHREALQAGRRGLVEVLQSEGLWPDDQALIFFSHWVAPLDIPRRFDTRFFIAEMPEAQTAVHCRVETTESIWITPRQALERAEAGTLPLVFPTRMHLRRLAAWPTYDEVLANALAKRIVTVQPTFGMGTTPESVDPSGERAEW